MRALERNSLRVEEIQRGYGFPGAPILVSTRRLNFSIFRRIRWFRLIAAKQSAEQNSSETPPTTASTDTSISTVNITLRVCGIIMTKDKLK